MSEPKRKRARKVAKKAATRTRRVAGISSEIPEDLKEFMGAIQKDYGENAVTQGDKVPLANCIPTGCFILDLALLGGVPEGYVSMFYGLPSSSKTTITLRTVAQYLKKNPTMFVGWVDAEGMYDPQWAEKNGVDTSRVLKMSPEYGELGVDFVEDLLSRKSIGMVVIDSLPSLVPMNVLEKSAEDDTMAAHPRLMGKLCSKITMTNNKERRKGHWVTTLMINQYRSKVGFFMGSPDVLPGGKQINHIPTTKIKLYKKGSDKGKDIYGNEVDDCDVLTFKLEKVKHGQSIKAGEFKLFLNPNNEYGLSEGEIDNYTTVGVYAKKMGFIGGGGGAYRILTEEGFDYEAGEYSKFRTLDDIKQWLRDNEDEYWTLAKSIVAAQRVAMNMPRLPPDGFLLSEMGRIVVLDETT